MLPGLPVLCLPNVRRSPAAAHIHAAVGCSALLGGQRWSRGIEQGKFLPRPNHLGRRETGRAQERQLRRHRFGQVVFAMIRQDVRNPLLREPGSPHEGDPSVQKRSLKYGIRRDRDVRVQEEATGGKTPKHLVSKALLVLDMMDREKRKTRSNGPSGREAFIFPSSTRTRVPYPASRADARSRIFDDASMAR